MTCAKFGLNLPVVLEKTMKIWDGYDNDDDNDDRTDTFRSENSIEPSAYSCYWKFDASISKLQIAKSMNQ